MTDGEHTWLDKMTQKKDPTSTTDLNQTPGKIVDGLQPMTRPNRLMLTERDERGGYILFPAAKAQE